jgi:hypothetical protein
VSPYFLSVMLGGGGGGEPHAEGMRPPRTVRGPENFEIYRIPEL